MKSKIVHSFMILLVLSGCGLNSKEKTITISGAFALYPLVVKWSEVYKMEHPEIQFVISKGGAGKGLDEALSGVVDLGMFSDEIAQQEYDENVWWVGLAFDAVVPTVSDTNPYLDIIKKRGVTRDEFRAIFIERSIADWGDLFNTHLRNPLVVYTRSDACGAAGTWAHFLGGRQENLKGIAIFGDAGLADAVANDPAGIAFNNTIFAYDITTGGKRSGIEVIPIDTNENGTIDPEEAFYSSMEDILRAIANGLYPSPPARELFFVSGGKPQKQAVLDFIEWTLTEGQQYVKESGYVTVGHGQIDGYLQKLK